MSVLDTVTAAPLAGLPRLSVTVDGAPLPAPDLLALQRARVHQRLDAPAQCELCFAAPRPELAGRLGVGARLALAAEATLFDGEITAIELAHRPDRTVELRARAYDRLHRLRKRQPVRAHVEVSLLDLARELTKDLALTVSAEEPGPVWQHLVQHRQSDLELLVDLASRAGLHLALRGDVLHLCSLQGLGPPIPLTWGDTLLEADVEQNADQGCAEVSASGWNVRDAEPHAGEARRTRALRPEAAGGWTGRVGTGPRALVDVSAEVPEQAEAQAQAELDRRCASEVVFRGVAAGDGRLSPLARVRLQGVADQARGEYVLTEVVHTADAERGFLSRLSTEPPPRRALAVAAATTFGVVTRVDAGSGRVQVRLPAYGAVETDWLQVATLGAGSGKGLTLLPDVDDLVLLLLAREDPAQAVVLGGIYGKGGPPDAGVEGGHVKRFTLHTRGGHKVTLDDARKAMRLEDPTGSFIDLSPDGVQLSAKVPLTIEAPGQPIVIRGDRVDFQRG